MHLTGMDIRDTPPFTELVELDFDARVNVFIGPNASGKSTLLWEMDAALNNEDRRVDSADHHWQFSRRRKGYLISGMGRQRYEAGDWRIEDDIILFTSDNWAGSYSIEGVNKEKQPAIAYIGPIRTGLPQLHDDVNADDEDLEISDALNRPFSGANYRVVNKLMHQKTDSMFDQQMADETLERVAHNMFAIRETAYQCVRFICAEMITSSSDPHMNTELRNYVSGFLMDNLDSQPLVNFSDVTIHRSLGINTIDIPNFADVRPEDRPMFSERMGKAPLYAGFLSSGTQTTFLWIHWLAYKMLNHYDFAEDWHKKPAILLIDEIENHLHPTWQRRVIPALLEHFPGLQIFATTHSPFVVAGLRAGQVHLLDRNSEGVVTASTTEQDIIGWTTDEILRSFMGVDQPTDELTIRRSNRLRELRRKESLSDEEREELEALRRQVNADLMSSRSPLDLQRERYGEMMMRFIESRKAQLSQDGA